MNNDWLREFTRFQSESHHPPDDVEVKDYAKVKRVGQTDAPVMVIFANETHWLLESIGSYSLYG